MSVLDTPEPLPEQTPPQQEIPDNVFNFHNGDLGKLKRIVQRQQLKTRIQFLQQVIRLHRPLVQAMQLTAKAFQDGVKEGLRQAIEAEKEAQLKAQATSSVVQAEQPGEVQAEPTPIPANSPHADLPRASASLASLLTS